jgi:hypothetical protein
LNLFLFISCPVGLHQVRESSKSMAIALRAYNHFFCVPQELGLQSIFVNMLKNSFAIFCSKY